MTSFLQEKRQYIPLLSLIAALLNLQHFMAGQAAPATFSFFLSLCFALAAFGAFYGIFFGLLSLLSPRLPIGIALFYILAALGRGPEGVAALFEGGVFPAALTWVSLTLILALALTSRQMDPLTQLRLPRNLLWPFALFCVAYVFLGLTLLRDAHWIVGVVAHLPVAAVFAFFLFFSDRLHVPAILNWTGLAAVIVLTAMGLGPHIPLEPPPMEGKGQNFLLITVEGLRHDAVVPSTMPNAAALARQGYLFTGMYGVSPAVEPNLQALMLRQRNGAPVNLVQLFPERFSRRALLPAVRETGMRPVLSGFSKVSVQGRRPFVARLVRAWIPVALFTPSDRAPSEEQVAEECRHLMEATSRPFIFWLHLDFPARALSRDTISRMRFGEALPAEELRADYEQGLRRLDSALGGLFRWMATRPWADKTNVLLLGVSGMELGDHGSAGGGHAYYDEAVRFPFLWSGPGVDRGAASTAISIQDIFPTLVKVFNLADKPKAFAGMDISSAFRCVFPADRHFPLSGNDAYPPGRAVVAGGFKLVQGPEGGFRLFDLAADPGERADRSCAEPARVEQMKGLLP